MAEKRGLLPTNSSDTLPEQVAVEGLPAYSKDDPHTADRKKSHKKKFWRAVKFGVSAFILLHLIGALVRRYRFGFFGRFDGGAFEESIDVTDEWVDGGFDEIVWYTPTDDVSELFHSHMTEDPIADEDPIHDGPDGSPHKHDNGRPQGAPGYPYYGSHEHSAHGPPGMPPHDRPHPPQHKMPHHPPMSRPGRHHITVECVIDGDGTSESLSLAVPFEPSVESFDMGASIATDITGEWTDFSFNVSAAVPRIVLASRGPVAGKVYLKADRSLSDDVTFDVSVSNPSLVKVCQLKHHDTFFGIALIADHHFHPSPEAIVHVYFPASGDTDIDAFTSHMSIFEHNVGDLADISFHKFTLGATNAAIKFEAITSDLAALTTSNAVIEGGVIDGEQIVLSTKNGAIEGVFPNVTGSLVLKTENAPIDANATLWSTAESFAPAYGKGKCGKGKGVVRKIRRWIRRHVHHRKARHAWKASREHGRKGHLGPERKDGTTLLAATSNEHIKIITALKSNTTGVFHVTATTKNGHILASVTEQPINATVSVTAHTSNNGIDVSLPAPFEGEYFCHTSNAKAHVVEKPDVKDPSGLDRPRNVEEKNLFGMLTGSVYWGDRKKRGTAVLTTSNAEIALTL